MTTAPAMASDRANIITTIDNFYIGDKTGSKKHKELSLHPKGAYRYVNKHGEYKEHIFTFKQGGADTSYHHELLSIDIYDNVAMVKLRLEKKETGEPEYKMMLLHKTNKKWLITSIVWGFNVIQ